LTYRQGYYKLRTFAGRTKNLNVAAHALYDAKTDVKPESCALPHVFGGVEGFKNAVSHFFAHSFSMNSVKSNNKLKSNLLRLL